MERNTIDLKNKERCYFCGKESSWCYLYRDFFYRVQYNLCNEHMTKVNRSGFFRLRRAWKNGVDV